MEVVGGEKGCAGRKAWGGIRRREDRRYGSHGGGGEGAMGEKTARGQSVWACWAGAGSGRRTGSWAGATYDSGQSRGVVAGDIRAAGQERRTAAGQSRGAGRERDATYGNGRRMVTNKGRPIGDYSVLEIDTSCQLRKYP
jgi:hypothetical protein